MAFIDARTIKIYVRALIKSHGLNAFHPILQFYSSKFKLRVIERHFHRSRSETRE